MLAVARWHDRCPGQTPAKLVMIDLHWYEHCYGAMDVAQAVKAVWPQTPVVIGGLTTVASGGASLLIGGGESAASAAVAQDGKIGPTVRVRVGAPIRVFTARDLDFSRAPEL